MPNLLEEALLDIEQIKAAVEEETKNKLVESLTPQIRKFISNKLYEGEVEVLRDQQEEFVTTNDQALEVQEDPNTREEIAVLDLDELKLPDEHEQILNLDDEMEVEVDVEELKNILATYRGDKAMKLKDIFLRGEKEECKEGCSDSDDLDVMEGEEEILEIDGNELMEAIKTMKAKRKLNEDEIVLNIDVDAEGEIEDVEVVSVGDEELEGEEDEFDIELGEEGEEGSEFDLEMEDEEGMEDLEDEEGMEDLEDVEVEEEMEEEEPMSVEESKLRKKIRKMIREAYKNKKANRKMKRRKKGLKEDVSIEVGDDVKVDIDSDSAGTAEVEVVSPDMDVEMDSDVEEIEEFEPLGMEENKKLKGSVKRLKGKLVETNLMNAKLVYANKLLMNNAITKKERIAIIESLDKAKSLREVELVYKTLVNKSKKTGRVDEGRKVLAGGSSATPTTRKQKDTLNESAEVEVSRWQEMAGIKG
jgi:hypothetical protein